MSAFHKGYGDCKPGQAAAYDDDVLLFLHVSLGCIPCGFAILLTMSAQFSKQKDLRNVDNLKLFALYCSAIDLGDKQSEALEQLPRTDIMYLDASRQLVPLSVHGHRRIESGSIHPDSVRPSVGLEIGSI